jgi:2',3'-cyclic-nucleotide 2'-phosphodiesterase (5'-nucleotidase family)
VTAYNWGAFLGHLDVTFHHGTVVSYDGNPIFMGQDVAKTTAVEAMLEPYRAEVDALMNLKVGETTVDLLIEVGGQRICRLGECLMGNLVADVMLWKANQMDPGANYQIALQNGGGLRAPLNAGDVTYGGVVTVLPFGNTIATMELKGENLLAALEHSVRLYPSANGGFLQVSGMRYYFDPTMPVGSRITGAEIMSGSSYVPLDPNATYKVVTNDFTRKGGDGYTWFRDYAINPYDFGPNLADAVIDYFENYSPVTPELEGRIVKLDKTITILHTNDTHGRWEADSYHGGMAYVASLIAQERAKNPNALLLDAGDTFQGNSFASFFRDATPNPIAGGMNLLNYDAIVLGNHEFNFGPTTFGTMMGQINFPILGSANLDDDGTYGLAAVGVKDYITKTVDGLDVVIFGLTNPRVPRYELPTNIEGLSFHSATETAQLQVPTLLATENPDLLISLNHIGYSPYAGEPDSDLLVAQQVAGIDVIIGPHSHTVLNPAVMVTSTVNPTGTLIAQAGRYAGYLGKVNIGFTGNMTDGYQIVVRTGYLIPTTNATTDPALTAYLAPFSTQIAAYNATEIGQTEVPIDALDAFTQETNGANLQADASLWKLNSTLAPTTIDFHLSGAMTNRKIASTASATTPYTLTKGDMFDLMPYENSLVAFELNGAQLKAILERGYRNYWYYKNDPGNWGGYSHYTTCMLDISAGGVITYTDDPLTYTASVDHIAGMSLNGVPLMLTADYTYTVSTVNYIAAGSCNFNNAGETIWPLDQIIADTQFYVRDVVTEYVPTLPQPIAPAIEGRLVFVAP